MISHTQETYELQDNRQRYYIGDGKETQACYAYIVHTDTRYDPTPANTLNTISCLSRNARNFVIPNASPLIRFANATALPSVLVRRRLKSVG